MPEGEGKPKRVQSPAQKARAKLVSDYMKKHKVSLKEALIALKKDAGKGEGVLTLRGSTVAVPKDYKPKAPMLQPLQDPPKRTTKRYLVFKGASGNQFALPEKSQWVQYVRTTKGSGVEGASAIIDSTGKLVDSLGNSAEKFGEQIDKGRRTTQEIREQQGKNNATRAKYANKTKTEQLLEFNRYLDKLHDLRAHNSGTLPYNLKLAYFDLPKVGYKLKMHREKLQRADKALYDYAYKEFYG